MYQAVISTFKSYYLKNTSYKPIGAIDSDSSDESEQSKLKTFWTGFTILDATRNIYDSWEEVNTSTVWKKLIPVLMDDFESVKTSVEEVTPHVAKRARELEVKPEDVTELLQSHDKIEMDEQLLFMDEQRKWLLEMESTSGEEAVKIVEMIRKDLEYYKNLIDKSVAAFERTDSNFERSSTLGKTLSNSIACYREIVHERER